jgi:hypothetical protein
MEKDMKTTKRGAAGDLRVVMICRRGKLRRMRFQELSGNGKFLPISRPWSEQDVAHVQLFGKALNRAAKEMSQRFDVEQLIAKVNTPSRSRRRVEKKPPSPGLIDDDEAEWE